MSAWIGPAVGWMRSGVGLGATRRGDGAGRRGSVAMAEGRAAIAAARWDLLEVLRRLAGLLAVPAAFYAVGYLIVFAFVLSTRLQAWFWFTEAFYREAGAMFLIDALMSLALLPQVFVVLSALLIALFPAASGRGLLAAGVPAQHGAGRPGLPVAVMPVLRQLCFFGVLAAGALLTAVVLRGCSHWICQPPKGAFVGAWVLGPSALDAYFARQPAMYRGATFFAVALPTLIALGMLTLRAWMSEIQPPVSDGDGTQAQQAPAPRRAHPLAVLLLTSAFAVLAVVIPVGYGTQFFDLVAAPVANPQQCVEAGRSSSSHDAGSAAAATTGLDCYLLGKFDAHYILIGREYEIARALSPDASPYPAAIPQRIYVKQVSMLEPFSIKATEPMSVRNLTAISAYPPSTDGADAVN